MKVEKSSATFHIAGSCGNFLGLFSPFPGEFFMPIDWNVKQDSITQKYVWEKGKILNNHNQLINNDNNIK